MIFKGSETLSSMSITIIYVSSDEYWCRWCNSCAAPSSLLRPMTSLSSRSCRLLTASLSDGSWNLYSSLRTLAPRTDERTLEHHMICIIAQRIGYYHLFSSMIVHPCLEQFLIWTNDESDLCPVAGYKPTMIPKISRILDLHSIFYGYCCGAQNYWVPTKNRFRTIKNFYSSEYFILNRSWPLF